MFGPRTDGKREKAAFGRKRRTGQERQLVLPAEPIGM
jgi:hypothetical protein